jgi:DNA ligase (NAD+)
MEKELRIKQLVNAIIFANENYRKGNPNISDITYDSLKEELKQLDPENELLKKGIIEEVINSERKETLPVQMFSLEFCKNWKEYTDWVIKNSLQEETAILTPKLDGMSLLCEEQNKHSWTRGNGIIGQNSDKWYAYINRNRVSSSLYQERYNWGEAIILPKDWSIVKQWAPYYQSPRNAVAGLFNADKNFPKDILPFVTYIRYGFSDQEGEQLPKEQQLIYLNSIQLVKIPFIKIKFKDLTKELVDEKFKLWRENFDMDGVVIEANMPEIREELGRESNNNPKYARALKLGWEEIKRTKILDIKIQVSKDGRLKPIGIIQPVILANAEVTNCSLYNIKNIYDKGIGIGSEVDIIRSGEVIPKIIKVIEPIQNVLYIAQQIQKILHKQFLFLNEINFSSYIGWDDTGTDLILKQRHPLWDIAEITFFFNTLEVEYFDEPSIIKLYEAGFTTIKSILEITKEQLLHIEGFGESTANYLLNLFEEFKIEGVELYYLAAASNKFGRMGVTLLSEISYEYWTDGNIPTKTYLQSLPNFGEVRAQMFLDGLSKFKEFIKDLPIKILQPKPQEIFSYKLKDKIFVFTGFRDENLEQQIIFNGGSIGSAISKNTTALICKEKETGTSKEMKAKKLNIEILLLQDFKDKYNFI